MLKKSIVGLLLVVLAFALFSCGSKEVTKTEPKEETIAVEETAEVPEVVEEEPESEVIEEEPEPEAIEEPENTLGSRKDPAKIGDTIYVSGENYDAKMEYAIQVTSVIRGQEAIDIAMAENDFNDFEEGDELVVVGIRYELISYEPKNGDDPYYLNPFYGVFFDVNYQELEDLSLVVYPDSINGREIYEGAIVEGNLLKVEKMDVVKFLRWDSLVWFDLE